MEGIIDRRRSPAKFPIQQQTGISPSVASPRLYFSIMQCPKFSTIRPKRWFIHCRFISVKVKQERKKENSAPFFAYLRFRAANFVPLFFFISLLTDDKAGRTRAEERERRVARDSTRYHPSRVEEESRWPRASSGSLKELQQFRNCFPFFCSLNCFPRSAVLSEAPPLSNRSSRCPLDVDTPPTTSGTERSLGKLFVIIAFPPANKATE